MKKSLLTGNIGEDEKEAFQVLIKEHGLEDSDVKGVGYANRLTALCKKAKLKLITDYNSGEFAVEYVTKLEVPSEDLEIPEEVKNLVSAVGGKMVDDVDSSKESDLESLLE